jgi:hypothetical protein
MVSPMVRRLRIVALSLALLPSAAAAEKAPQRSETPERPSNSEALRPRAGAFSVAALLGANYGEEGGIRAGRLMFGYGGRAGYSFETTPLYLGVTVFGYGREVDYEETSETGSEHYINVDIDIGVELTLVVLVLRPYLGLGMMVGVYESPWGGNSALSPRVVPALLVRYPLGPIDIGVDARLEAASIGPTTVSALGHVGVAF